MHKTTTTRRHLIEQDRPDRYSDRGKGVPSSLDQQLSRLVLLLQQLEKSLPGLVSIPESELSEIVYGAIRLCGFVDPIEAEYAIENVLETLEERSISASQCSGGCAPPTSEITGHSDN
jgi:hypothetical protein